MRDGSGEFNAETRRSGVLRIDLDVVRVAANLGVAFLSLFLASLFFSASPRLRVEMTFRDKVISC